MARLLHRLRMGVPIMENKVKQLLGEYAFTVAALQHQLEEAVSSLADANKKIEELNARSTKTK